MILLWHIRNNAFGNAARRDNGVEETVFIAVFRDIHSNHIALEACFRYIEKYMTVAKDPDGNVTEVLR
ncbi:hypothetical protein CE91St56_39220 [Lachnospiraceae bacterium]|nr:hypothetical protein CE91St56_39220 [Lachnospiraceae bacterium]GKH42872.1 hypothetical protein CE91St57_38460 [Lachnospiraceae bacterium]